MNQKVKTPNTISSEIYVAMKETIENMLDWKLVLIPIAHFLTANDEHKEHRSTEVLISRMQSKQLKSRTFAHIKISGDNILIHIFIWKILLLKWNQLLQPNLLEF